MGLNTEENKNNQPFAMPLNDPINEEAPSRERKRVKWDFNEIASASADVDRT